MAIYKAKGLAMMDHLARTIATAAALLLAAGTAQAAEIDALITTAMNDAIVELAPAFERTSGHKLA